ncbi:putative mitochondrial hypothetical protein [Leptomonas pyrrhocoris]|uniref:Uncharacterized protein n=1 Tax=Leptomonas pyrrhocoris TaxID=157538 RepID=A0A0M9FXF6_LEPPY|nr:putative mitochondrial hypothetical protein [Leptomonas pyrrhocoris]KPA78065.1 putative mitochondrial hypothetical protein [Leptomonas pyrrhocoris]|eukprot:XP_015656504.1 putative mitochondrial hypothetical protein [Leptomonas pyrrhocoris]
MSLQRSRLLRSAYDELVVVGSRWTQMLANSPEVAEAGPPYVQAHLALPKVTLIPTLHVASMKFYDRVLEYIDQAVRRNKETVVLLEGICDSNAAEKQQMQEYIDIMQNQSLQQTMIAKADDNTLYSPEVMREICQELGVRYDLLQSLEPTVRLQECYLKPKLAATCGLNLRNNADLDMHEVQKLLEEETARLHSRGENLPSSVAVSQLGSFPIIRKHRELKVATVARAYCEGWFEKEIDAEVIIPWGYFHSEAIIHYILEGNKLVGGSVQKDGEGGGAAGSSGAAGGERGDSAGSGAAAVASPARKAPRLVFVEADELIAKVPFNVPKELIEPVQDAPRAKPQG